MEKRALLQAGNREWVTSIECITASWKCSPSALRFQRKTVPRAFTTLSPFKSKRGSSNHELKWLDYQYNWFVVVKTSFHPKYWDKSGKILLTGP